MYRVKYEYRINTELSTQIQGTQSHATRHLCQKIRTKTPVYSNTIIGWIIWKQWHCCSVHTVNVWSLLNERKRDEKSDLRKCGDTRKRTYIRYPNNKTESEIKREIICSCCFWVFTHALRAHIPTCEMFIWTQHTLYVNMSNIWWTTLSVAHAIKTQWCRWFLSIGCHRLCATLKSYEMA